MDSDSNPFELIRALCKAGFTVEMSGEGHGWVAIRTENSDIAYGIGSDTLELALLNATTHLYAWLTKTAEALKPFGEMTSGQTPDE